MEINKIYNESNLETMARMPDNFVDLTVTSPPYDNLRTYNGYSFDFENVAKELFRVTKQGGVVVWVVSDATINGSETGSSFKQALFFIQCGFNLHDTMIWEKHTIPQNGNRYESAFEYMFVVSKGKPKTFNPIKVKKIYTDNRKTKKYQRDKEGIEQSGNVPQITEKIDYNIWKIDVGGGIVTNDKNAHKHPAIFPDELAKKHIYSWSNEGELVYDCFSGSGTTLKMAHLQKRNWIGSEISSEYVELANKRLDPYLRQTSLF